MHSQRAAQRIFYGNVAMFVVLFAVTLSGFVRARNGELIAFSFLYNGRSTSAARGVQTELGTLLADFTR